MWWIYKDDPPDVLPHFLQAIDISYGARTSCASSIAGSSAIQAIDVSYGAHTSCASSIVSFSTMHNSDPQCWNPFKYDMDSRSLTKTYQCVSRDIINSGLDIRAPRVDNEMGFSRTGTLIYYYMDAP